MVPTDGLTVGIDVGGTVTKAVVLDGTGAVQHAACRPTEVAGPGTLSSFVVECVRAARGAVPGRLDAVGVALPGMVDPPTGTVRHALNLGLAEHPQPIASPVVEAIGVPCVVENDANAAALGSLALLGLDPGASLAYLGFGTGVAAGIVLDGQLWRGTTGAAGEIGHVRFGGSGPRCLCGRRGCLEALASGSSLSRYRRRRVPSTAVELFEAAAAGNRQAAAARDGLVRVIAGATEMVLLTLDVSWVVLGGGLSEVGPALVDAVAAASGTVAFGRELDVGRRLVLTPEPLFVGAIGMGLLAGRPAPPGDGR